MYVNIDVKQEGATAILTINREKQLNALNRETLEEIDRAFRHFEIDSNIRGVLITGAGQKAFVAGADIKEFKDYTAAEGKALSKWGHEVMDRIYHFSKPVLAAINGFALGGGLELALACHIRIASDSAKLGLPEVSLGLIPGYGGTQRLTELVGRGRALEMIMTADMVEAVDAHKWGLVNIIASPDQLYDTSLALLNKTYQRSSSAVAASIEAVNAGLDTNKDGYAAEVNLFGACFGTPDFNEGVDAFLSKRKPKF